MESRVKEGGARASDSALTRRIQQARGRLSSGRRNLLDGILSDVQETVFLSSHELAARFRTNPATVVRTVQALGYDGFPNFARDLREHFLQHVNPYRILAQEVTEHRGAAFHVQACIEHDVQNVKMAGQALDPALLARVGKRLHSARHIVVTAGDLDHNLAAFLAYGLSALGLQATAPAGEGLTLHRQRALTQKDAVIAISFRRCLRVPVETVRAARKARAFSLAITDEATTPLARQASQALVVPIEGESFASSYAATMVAINALLVACSHADPKQSLRFLKPTEAEYESGARWFSDPDSGPPPPRRKNGARSASRRRI